MSVAELRPNLDHWQERVDLAAVFRWTVRLNMHEAVANHFSVAVNDDGTQFLMNPNQMHFDRTRASDLLLLDANDPDTMNRPGAPDPTAWALHSALHRECPHARCALHVHSIHATVLASLQDSILPPLEQNSAMFFNRQVVDDQYGGLAFDDEAKRCAEALSDPKKFVLIMGNHGIMVIGATVAETFNRMFYFERAAEVYVRALQTGQPLRILSDEVAEKTASEIENYPEQATRHLDEVKKLLEREGSDYAT